MNNLVTDLLSSADHVTGHMDSPNLGYYIYHTIYNAANI